MKKIAIALTALLLVLSLTACDKKDTDQVNDQPAQNEDTQPLSDESGDSQKGQADEADKVVASSSQDDESQTEDDQTSSDSNDDRKKNTSKLSEDKAIDAYKSMVERFEAESPVDVYDDVLALLPRLPDKISSILFAKFDRYMELWSMNYTDQMYFEDGPMSEMDISLGDAYDYETNSYDLTKIENETHRAIIESLFDNGFKFVWMEGSPYPIADYSNLKRLSEKVPEEVMAFILVMSTETDKITAADAGLLIGWNELAKRTVQTESALKIIENEDMYTKLESLYRFYSNAYLLGMNNTPVVSWDDNTILEEVRQSYETTLEKYPKSELSKILTKYMETLKTYDYTLPYENQDEFQAIVKLQSDWIDEATKNIHKHHNH